MSEHTGWGVFRVDAVRNGRALGAWIKEGRAIWMGSEEDAKRKAGERNITHGGHVALRFADTTTTRASRDAP